MPFDALIANPGRLRILAALASVGGQDFINLRRATRLTDGNLSSHAKRLAGAGIIQIEKSFRQGRPVTTLTLTPRGRSQLESHVRALLAAVTPSGDRGDNTVAPPITVDQFQDGQRDEDWVD